MLKKYSDYIEISPTFESVVDIDADTRNKNLWREYIVGEDTVSSVHLKLCFGRESRVGLWNNECVYVEGYDYSIDPKNIFRDREAAEAMAKELNEKNG